MLLNKKYPLWFYIVPFFISFIILILTEIGLRFFNYGEDLSFWVEYDNKLKLNPNIAKKYFRNTKAIPYPLPDFFDKIKSKESIRIFVIGESSSAGFPYSPNGTFSKYIKLKLENDFPKKKIEVINLSMAAINSYTFEDFVNQIIDKNPDAILIYGGHNEYYGALGVGSYEFFSNSIILNKLLIKLNDFKIFQLVNNIINSISGSLYSENKSGTLMQRMVRDKLIQYDSDIFNAGIEQFKINLESILSNTTKANIPVFIGLLVSNLRDQKPFITDNNSKNANNFFLQAREEEKNNNYLKADSLYRLAKDYDLLKFRAPEKINNIINQFSKKYFVKIVNVDSAFRAFSPNGLIGNNLMTDHLHPTLEGYKIIGELFYQSILKNKLLVIPEKVSPNEFDYSFTSLDSTIADFRIKVLKNSWPYKLDETNTINAYKNISLKNIVDSVAFDVLKEKLSWEAAHRTIADYFYTKKEYDLYIKEINVLIDQFPFYKYYYETSATRLIQINRFDLAEKILTKQIRNSPSDFAYKWLGNILLQKCDYKNAILYLEKSLIKNSNDAQTLYNLSGAYLMTNNFVKSKGYITKCLNVNPNYTEAKKLLQEINTLTKK